MRFPSVVEWCCPSPSIFLPFGLCIVESSPIRYPVTTGGLGRPRCLGCSWRCRCNSAATHGCISSRKCLERAFCHGFGFPGRLREKATQSCQARSRADLTQQAAQGSPSFTLHQPQQHGHEVLVLGLGEQVLEPLGKVAHLFIQTYNGDWHWTPPGSQGLFFFSLIPHGVLSCHSPFQKCKHRGCTASTVWTKKPRPRSLPICPTPLILRRWERSTVVVSCTNRTTGEERACSLVCCR